jgi:hypothetical protein
MTARQINNIDFLFLASYAHWGSRGGAHHSTDPITLKFSAVPLNIKISQNMLSKYLIWALRVRLHFLDKLIPLDHQRKIACCAPSHVLLPWVVLFLPILQSDTTVEAANSVSNASVMEPSFCQQQRFLGQ